MSWWHNLIEFIQERYRHLAESLEERRKFNRLRSVKRRAEYLFTSPRQAGKHFLLKLHPQNLLSFLFSKAGLYFGFKVGLTLFVILLTVVLAAYFYYRGSAPVNLANLQSCLDSRVIEFYDRSGQHLLWRKIEGSICQQVELDEVSPYFIDGLITIEDKDFYQHPGFKFTSIARALINNLLGGSQQGGSTITQQYIKNAVIRDSNRSYARKIKEAVLVPEIEHLYSKEEILTAYLNTLFLGHNYNGIEAAAQGYFAKPSSDLTLDEAALLVGAIQAPTVIWENPEFHLTKRNIVLTEMLADNKISQEEYNQALATDTLAKVVSQDYLEKNRSKIIAPHFVLETERQALALLCQNNSVCTNLPADKYKIITTLDLNTQEQIEKTIADLQQQLIATPYDNLAAIVIDKQERHVLGLVGSIDINQPDFGQFNQVSAAIEPLNLWHPLVYLALLDSNKQTQLSTSTYQALGSADNEIALEAIKLTGVNQVNFVADKLNLNHLDNCKTNSCLGPQSAGYNFRVRLDYLANAYMTLGSQGQHQDLNYILEIIEQDDSLYRWHNDSVRVIDVADSQQIDAILRSRDFKVTELPADSQLGFRARISNNWRYNYSIAYNQTVALGVYLGSENYSSEEDDPLNQEEALKHQANLIRSLLDKLASKQ